MAELPGNPGSQGSSGPPPFQPVAGQYQPVPAPSQGYAAPPPPPAAPPAKSGGSGVLKIILIVLGVIVVMVMLVIGVVGYIGWRVAHAIHVNNSNGSMSINTPGGAISANSGEKFTADELGTDIYPGAQPSKSGSLRMSLPTGSVVSATFLTSDSKDQVVAFYKGKLGSQATTMDFASNAIISLKKSEHDMLTLTISQEANQADGKTQIHIQHTTDNQAK